MAPNGAGKLFFRLIQTLPMFWATGNWILRIVTFEIFGIDNFWIFRFTYFQNLPQAGPEPRPAVLEPSGPKNVDVPFLILLFELATACFV